MKNYDNKNIILKYNKTFSFKGNKTFNVYIQNANLFEIDKNVFIKRIFIKSEASYFIDHLVVNDETLSFKLDENEIDDKIDFNDKCTLLNSEYLIVVNNDNNINYKCNDIRNFNVVLPSNIDINEIQIFVKPCEIYKKSFKCIGNLFWSEKML